MIHWHANTGKQLGPVIKDNEQSSQYVCYRPDGLEFVTCGEFYSLLSNDTQLSTPCVQTAMLMYDVITLYRHRPNGARLRRQNNAKSLHGKLWDPRRKCWTFQQNLLCAVPSNRYQSVGERRMGLHDPSVGYSRKPVRPLNFRPSHLWVRAHAKR